MSNRVWHDAEEDYLKQLHDLSLRLSKTYMQLYKVSHSKQTKLRLPTIIVSSFSGVASFGSTTFPPRAQKYVSIAIGVVNVGIAMIQTYESYLKIGDTVAKSLSVANGLKKLADDIFTELYIPVADRDDDGIIFLRDCVNRYQVILDQAPPLTDELGTENESHLLKKKIQDAIRLSNMRAREERVELGKTFRPTYNEETLLPPRHVYRHTSDARIVVR
jgi:hypothetical protein